MNVTSSATARRSASLALSRSGGSPQTPGPVIRIAPNPSRFTVRSPPTSIFPAAAAVSLAFMSAPSWTSACRPFVHVDFVSPTVGSRTFQIPAPIHQTPSAGTPLILVVPAVVGGLQDGAGRGRSERRARMSASVITPGVLRNWSLRGGAHRAPLQVLGEPPKLNRARPGAGGGARHN